MSEDLVKRTADFFKSLVEYLPGAPDSQLSSQWREKAKKFLATDPGEQAAYLFLDQVSQLPQAEISSFVGALCDVRKYYSCPEEANALSEVAGEIERLRSGLQLVLDWYDRDGSVGGCSNLIDDIRPLLEPRGGA